MLKSSNHKILKSLLFVAENIRPAFYKHIRYTINCNTKE